MQAPYYGTVNQTGSLKTGLALRTARPVNRLTVNIPSFNVLVVLDLVMVQLSWSVTPLQGARLQSWSQVSGHSVKLGHCMPLPHYKPNTVVVHTDEFMTGCEHSRNGVERAKSQVEHGAVSCRVGMER